MICSKCPLTIPGRRWQYGPRGRQMLCMCFWLCSGRSHKMLDGYLERCSCLLSCFLAVCLLNEGARQSLLLAGDNTCQIVRGHLLQSITPLRGRGETTTLALPEGPYMQTRRRTRQELTHSEYSENGSKMRRFTTHSHTFNLQGRSRLNAYTANQRTTKLNKYILNYK